MATENTVKNKISNIHAMLFTDILNFKTEMENTEKKNPSYMLLTDVSNFNMATENLIQTTFPINNTGHQFLSLLDTTFTPPK